ncbi:hypothetical protein [Paracoccus marinus]|uniref:hypothetical protein n=1 Tax=Paracoccus marinus TaxID=288426 RepID=UPI00103A2743|nr:hypothetical protein [Paracoccus marinus]
MFPQIGVLLETLKTFTASAYWTMMNESSVWVKAGAEVRLDVRLGTMDASGRPGIVDVRYEVIDPTTGRLVYPNEHLFNNSAGQGFSRLTRKEIAERLEIERR